MAVVNEIRAQSNSFRGEFLRNIKDLTVHEILDNVRGMLGPGATDAILTKEDMPYYTRDGKETMGSLKFNNTLMQYIHNILYQPVYNQGQAVGDGSTTLAVLYCHLYNIVSGVYDNSCQRDSIENSNINYIRKAWTMMCDKLCECIMKEKVDITDENLISMLYTCTQDVSLAARIYTKLGDAIKAGAYIVPRKSNIATDFNINVYTRPTFKVSKEFSLKPVKAEEEKCVVYFCDGAIDIANSEVLAGIAANVQYYDPLRVETRIPMTVILLGYGVTDVTRRSVKEFIQVIKDNNWDVEDFNNVAIYTLKDYRSFSREEMDDLVSIFTEEPGTSGMTQSITFEMYLYNSICNLTALGIDRITTLEKFDTDMHIVDQMKNIFYKPYKIFFDDINGMAIDRSLSPVAEARYQELKKMIEEEKSPVVRNDLNKRLRKVFGMFIDVEVGSTLMKDSQRKFELILDALLSSTEAAKDGMITGNGILCAITTIYTDNEFISYCEENKLMDFRDILFYGLYYTFMDLVANYNNLKHSIDEYNDAMKTLNFMAAIESDNYDYHDFNFYAKKGDEIYWPNVEDAKTDDDFRPLTETYTDDEGNTTEVIKRICEPINVIKAIIKNSITAIELYKINNIHIPIQYAMNIGNYISDK